MPTKANTTFPKLNDDIFKNSKLRNHIEIYINLEGAYPNELFTSVKEGDDIHITLMLSGG